MPVVVEGFDMKIVFLLERAAIKAGTTFSYRWREGEKRCLMFNAGSINVFTIMGPVDGRGRMCMSKMAAPRHLRRVYFV